MPFTTTIIDGGLDLITPAQAVKPGMLTKCINYEIARVRGVRRMDGYERYDGGPSPSATGAYFVFVSYTGGTAAGTGSAAIWIDVNNGNNCNIVDDTYFPAEVTSTFLTDVLIPAVGGVTPELLVTTATLFPQGSYCVVVNAGGTRSFVGKVTTNTGPGVILTCVSILTGTAGQLIVAAGGLMKKSDLNGITLHFGNATLFFTTPDIENPLTNYIGAGFLTTPTLALGAVKDLYTVPATATTNLDAITDQYATFLQVSAQIQQVPGQGNVNGVFWLKDVLYATRDYLTPFFTAGNTEPALGDTVFIGLSFAGATFTGQVFRVNVESGSWIAGDAAGSLTLYNTTGTLTSGTLKNHTAGDIFVATMSGGTIPATAAGMYAAIGGRGQTLPTQSWQWCDLGWNVQYNNGVADFVDMNVALTQANKALQVKQYVTTAWHQATTGFINTSSSGWQLTGGTWPAVVAVEGDGQFVYHNFSSGISKFPLSGSMTMDGFGFTDADIPSTASISGMEIQFRAGAIGVNGGYVTAPIDVTFELKGLSSGQKGPIFSSTPYTVTPSAPAIDPIDGTHYTLYSFTTKDIGPPAELPDTPTSLLGYTGLTPAEIKQAAFGLSYQIGLQTPQATVQKIQFGIDMVQIRFSYLPETNGVYFWNNQSTVVADGAITAGSDQFTSASTVFTSADIGKTITIAGAGLLSSVTDGSMPATSTALTSPLSGFVAAMINLPITVNGAGAQVGPNLSGSMPQNSKVLTVATTPFTSADIGRGVFVTGAVAGGLDLTSRIVSFVATNQVVLADACTRSGGVAGVVTKVYGLLTTTISAVPVTPNTATLGAASTIAVSGAEVKIYDVLSATIIAIGGSPFHTVTLSRKADRTVSAASSSISQPVPANVVMHYKQGGDIGNQNAYGALYFQLVNSLGVVGGVPPRTIGANEQIRTMPLGDVAPDGGVSDGSVLIANTSTAADRNTMDHSALLQGSPQPDGTNSPPSKYQSVTKNFYASAGLNAIYGVSGGGPAFYYDGLKTDASGGTVAGNFSRILTGLPLQFETPRQIAYHQSVIVLGYYHGVVQSSNAANTLSFDPRLFDQVAKDIGVGDNVTGLASVNGDTLAIWTRTSIQMVQGNFSSNNPPTLYTSTLAPTSGGIEYTAQPMANYTYCDFRGVTALSATQKYGDFEIGHFSAIVQPWIIPRVQTSAFFEGGTNIGINNSVLMRNKNMVRYFFNDGAALSLTYLVDGENPQFSIQQYYTDENFPIVWEVAQAFTETAGRDRIFGTTPQVPGYVFELERSNTFDGNAIEGYVTFVPDVAQVPYLNKVFTGINVFGLAQDYATFNLSRSPDYVIPVKATGMNVITETFGSGSAAPTGAINPFRSLGTAGLMIEGTAINLRFDFSTNQQFSHTIQALSYTVDQAQDNVE